MFLAIYLLSTAGEQAWDKLYTDFSKKKKTTQHLQKIHLGSVFGDTSIRTGLFPKALAQKSGRVYITVVCTEITDLVF